MNDRASSRAEESVDQAASGMAAEHALLGLLALSDSGTGHGYELARNFDASAPLGNVLRLEPGMVYHHLKKLERIGWTEAIPDVDGRPARRTMALTAAGRAELGRWLAEPVGHTREIRLEFLVKLYFALLLDPGLAARLVAEQRDICARQIESLAERLRQRAPSGSERSRERRFGEMVLDMRLAQTEAALAWLDRVGQDALTAIAGQRVAGTGE